MAQQDRLARVRNRREFMDRLYHMNDPPKRRKTGEKTRGRLTELKTYILECNEVFRAGRGDRFSWEVEDTGVDTIKILNVKRNGTAPTLQFYMDMTDRRFLLLHTDELAEKANDAVEGLVGEYQHRFDHTWFHSDLLKKWARGLDGGFSGYAINYGGVLHGKDDTLKMEVSGTNAKKLYDALPDLRDTDRLLSHEAIEMRKGPKKPIGAFVEERIANMGYFSIKHGKSIANHLDIVSDCKNEYKEMITNVEKCRMRTSSQNGYDVFEGRPLAITYPTVNNLARFVDTMFNAKKPFKLWGIKLLRKEGQYSVPAVDLHEGSAINFEITPYMMRIYLEPGSCGNTIMRLITNLQTHYSAQTKCSDLE